MPKVPWLLMTALLTMLISPVPVQVVDPALVSTPPDIPFVAEPLTLSVAPEPIVSEPVPPEPTLIVPPLQLRLLLIVGVPLPPRRPPVNVIAAIFAPALKFTVP